MFYTNLLSVPCCFLFAGDLWQHVSLLSQSPVLQLSPFPLPSMWVFVGVNILSQMVCVSGVHMVTSAGGTGKIVGVICFLSNSIAQSMACSSRCKRYVLFFTVPSCSQIFNVFVFVQVVCTMALTVRKCISLMWSIYFFNNKVG